MKVLEIGPSETRARGGMSEVIRGIRESEILGREFEIDSFPSYIDGSLPARLLYTVYGYLRFLGCCRKYDLFHIHTAGQHLPQKFLPVVGEAGGEEGHRPHSWRRVFGLLRWADRAEKEGGGRLFPPGGFGACPVRQLEAGIGAPVFHEGL